MSTVLNMEDPEFFAHLEAKLGQKWTREERWRLWTSVPRYGTIRLRFFAPHQQREALDIVYAAITKRVADRLDGK